MRIRYAARAVPFLRALRDRDEAEYHALNGIVVQLSAMPDIDNETKFIYQGALRDSAVYRGEKWVIFYRVDFIGDGGEEVLVVISIYDADTELHTRL